MRCCLRAASIQNLGDATVNAKHVTCYTISGFDFTPTPFWLDDNDELFANVSPWASLIREGFGRDVAQQLIDKQRGWLDASAIARAAQLTHHPKGGAIVITNTRLHRDDRLGSIEKGKLADLILVDGDPTTNIHDIRKVTTVIKDGLMFDVAELDREIGVKP